MLKNDWDSSLLPSSIVAPWPSAHLHIRTALLSYRTRKGTVNLEILRVTLGTDVDPRIAVSKLRFIERLT
jgi:hypothetical protein